MAKKPKRRRYTDEYRATALAALAANAGNIIKTARELKMPEVTLRQWANGQRHTEALQMSEDKKLPLADAIEEVTRKMVAAVVDKIDGAALQPLAVSIGILIDKTQLLRELPTGITRNEKANDLEELTDEELARQLAAARSRIAAAGADSTSPGESGAVPSANGNGTARVGPAR